MQPVAELSLCAPAKLNLFLHINRRRKDGYHELQTLFQLLDNGDRLDFSLLPTGASTKPIAIAPELPGVRLEDNLIFKAACVLQNHAEMTGKSVFPPVLINLRKQLPMGGGVGGGSSNAASTLLALNQLWELDFPINTLARIGLGLGADVPVFVQGRSAYAEGVGELLQPLDLPLTWYLVIHPGCQVSTAEVFCHKQLTRDTSKSTIAPALEGDPGKLVYGHPLARNDCQSVVCELYPEIRQAMTWLSQFSPARLTGTGACIFACFQEKDQANQVLSRMPTPYQGFVAKGVNISPAHEELGRFCKLQEQRVSSR